MNMKPPCRAELEQQDTYRMQDAILQVKLQQQFSASQEVCLVSKGI